MPRDGGGGVLALRPRIVRPCSQVRCWLCWLSGWNLARSLGNRGIVVINLFRTTPQSLGTYAVYTKVPTELLSHVSDSVAQWVVLCNQQNVCFSRSLM